MRAQCRVEDTQERTPYREPPMALQPFHHLCSSKARVRQFLTGKKNQKQGKAILKNNYSQKATNITPKLPTGSPAGNLFEVSTWWRQRAELRGSAQAPSSVTCHQVSHVSRCSSTPSAWGAMRTRKFWSQRGGGYLSQAARCSTHCA